MRNQEPPNQARSSVVTVGDGRGFVVNGLRDRLVVTAAHCLPVFPPRDGMSDLRERTCRALLAPIGSEPAISAECLFVNPVADIAVFGSPDDQELSNEAEAYKTLVDAAFSLPIADVPEIGQGWLLSLDRRWFPCEVEYMKWVDGPLLITNAAQPIVGGMSGSPVVSDDGAAFGVVCWASNTGSTIHPRLFRDLPGWLLRAQPGFAPE
jgi:hypothetical protein